MDGEPPVTTRLAEDGVRPRPRLTVGVLVASSRDAMDGDRDSEVEGAGAKPMKTRAPDGGFGAAEVERVGEEVAKPRMALPGVSESEMELSFSSQTGGLCGG
jgi:hypothetical protein